jgi:alanine racemase
MTPHRQVAPVLKSNAYGHKIDLIAHELENEHVPFYIIDSYFEAEALRNEGIKTPLLVIGYVREESINNSRLKNIVYVISSLDSLRSIKKKTRIHLKIDTGMCRQGILPSERSEAVSIIQNNQNIILEGICSHFSDADSTDTSFTNKQIKIWNDTVEYFKQKFKFIKYFHISASEGHIYKDAYTNMTRLGIGLYGLTNINGLILKPVLEMKTIITSIKKIKKGDQVGYGRTFTADRDMTIATLALGYYEGVDRRLSNIGFVKIIDKNNLENFCPIIGRVSMNITIIDISKVSGIEIGNEVIVISKNKTDKNSVENIAKLCSSIPYEIVVHIPQHLKRIVVE